MSDQPVLTVNADAAVSAFAQITGTLADLKPVFRAFHAYHVRRIDSESRALDRGVAVASAPVRVLNAPDFGPSALPHRRFQAAGRWYGPRKAARRGPRTVGEMTVDRARPGSRLGLQGKLARQDRTRESAGGGMLEVTGDTLAYGPAGDADGLRARYSFTQADADRLMDLTEKALGGQAKALGLGSFGGGEDGA